MEIKQSSLMTTILALLTVLFTALVVMMELNRKLFTGFFWEPSIPDLELALFFLVLPLLTLYFTVSSFRTLFVDSTGIRLTRLLGEDELSEEEISWISSGKGWLFVESNTGKRLGNKIFFGHKHLNSRQVAALESAVAEMKNRVRSRYPNKTSTVLLKGAFRFMPIVFLAIIALFIFPLEVAVWMSDVPFPDALIVSVVLPLLVLAGVSIPCFFIGTLTEVQLSFDSVVLKYPFRKVRLLRNDNGGPGFILGDGYVTNGDGKRYSLRGLTLIGVEKLALIRAKWFA